MSGCGVTKQGGGLRVRVTKQGGGLRVGGSLGRLALGSFSSLPEWQLDRHLVIVVKLAEITDGFIVGFILQRDRPFVDPFQDLLPEGPVCSHLHLKIELVQVGVVLRGQVFLQEFSCGPVLLDEKVKCLLKLD